MGMVQCKDRLPADRGWCHGEEWKAALARVKGCDTGFEFRWFEVVARSRFDGSGIPLAFASLVIAIQSLITCASFFNRRDICVVVREAIRGWKVLHGVRSFDFISE